MYTQIILSLNLVAIVVLIILTIIRRPVSSEGKLEQALREEMRQSREEASKNARDLRDEVSRSQTSANESVIKLLNQLGNNQTTKLLEIQKSTEEKLENVGKTLDGKIGEMRNTVDTRIREIQKSNEDKLEQMRQTVDEKLHSTLEKRLGQSFELVSKQLEAVQRGLGEMQNLATGVGDLKRVLTNVRDRGTWGEIQLEAILEQILTKEQYARNVQTRDDSRELVEFAVKLPGRGDGDEPVWLPIDSKFPKEDYERLIEASKNADADGVKSATDGLTRRILSSAKDIRDKYLNPPKTTDFAIMFLPTEGLYAEVLRQPGLSDKLQQDYRVVPAGPTTLTAVLNSLRMGFRTLAIEKRSSEVWEVLAAVKTEFGKFGEVLSKVKKQLSTASKTIDNTAKRTRAMERKLEDVEALPAGDATKVLNLPDDLEDSESDENNEQ